MGRNRRVVFVEIFIFSANYFNTLILWSLMTFIETRNVRFSGVFFFSIGMYEVGGILKV